MSRLNPHQFFHGTSHQVEGDRIQPGSMVGKANYDYDSMGSTESGNSRNDYVFMAGPHNDYEDVPGPDDPEQAEREAWYWADSAGGYNNRTTVYAVDPADPQPDYAFGSNHWMSDVDVPIVDRIDIAPPDVSGEVSFPRQGTLPPQNWKPYTPNLAADDANHPFYDDVVDRDQRAHAKRRDAESAQDYLRRHGRPEGEQGRLF